MTDDSSTRSWDNAADAGIDHADQRLPDAVPAAAHAGAGRRRLGPPGARSRAGEARPRELGRRGGRVTGIDGSSRLIDAARRRAADAGLDVDYHCRNANALDGIADGAFDLIVASMVMMNVEDYGGTIREAHRVLEPGGALCISITHPCFSAPVSDWVGGKGARGQHFAVDRYFERIAWEDRISPGFRTPYAFQ
jgi:SAM-dependent methyltransferase